MRGCPGGWRDSRPLQLHATITPLTAVPPATTRLGMTARGSGLEAGTGGAPKPEAASRRGFLQEQPEALSLTTCWLAGLGRAEGAGRELQMRVKNQRKSAAQLSAVTQIGYPGAKENPAPIQVWWFFFNGWEALPCGFFGV